LKSGSLSLLEPSGPVQNCNGIASPFLLDAENGSSSCLGNVNSPQHLLAVGERKKLFFPASAREQAPVLLA